jgi:hypothetical protein
MPRNSTTQTTKQSNKIQSYNNMKSTNQPTYTPQNQVIEHKVQTPGFFSTIVQGFALGTGSSIARNIFENKIVHNNVESAPVQKIETCNQYNLCKKMDFPEECYSKMDQIEYQRCRL